MKKKVYRMVSNITILENGDIIFEQKLNAFYVIFFGIGTIFFKSKNKFICNKKEIEKIKQTTSVMTGILITMTTENKIHIFVNFVKWLYCLFKSR